MIDHGLDCFVELDDTAARRLTGDLCVSCTPQTQLMRPFLGEMTS